jgi:Domain of unknown function (DUF5615)
MDHRFANALRARGADVITVGDIGTFSFSDEDQLALAVERNRTFYTSNVGDFCQLHNLYLTTGKVQNVSRVLNWRTNETSLVFKRMSEK